MTAIAIMAWLAGIALVVLHALGVLAAMQVLPALILLMTLACTNSAVLLTARYIGAAVARETALIMIKRDDPPTDTDGKVINFPKR